MNEDQFIFITGTDTNIGKTHVTQKLLQGLAADGKMVVGLKPIASGKQATPQGYFNEDALRLQAASSKRLPYEAINPWCFDEPISPNIALQRMNQTLSLPTLDDRIFTADTKACDHVFIEGVGSLMTPITHDNLSNLDWIKHLNIPTILVVGLRLGCMGHAQLCVSVLQAHNIPVLGWIANRCDPDLRYPDENIENLTKMIPYPLLADMPFELA